MRSLFLLGVSVILLLGCAPTPNTSPAGNTAGGSPPPGSNVVTISDQAANFGGHEVPLPATRGQLVAALGEPSRTIDKVNKIFVWDQQGIYAYSKVDRDVVHDISFSFAKEEWDYAPHATFNGSIQLGGLQISKATTEAELLANGFTKELSLEKSLGTNVVVIEYDGELKSLGFSTP